MRTGAGLTLARFCRLKGLRASDVYDPDGVILTRAEAYAFDIEMESAAIREDRLDQGHFEGESVGARYDHKRRHMDATGSEKLDRAIQRMRQEQGA